jgi:flagellar basal body rod protein FlgG
MEALDILANNLANTSTPGFKADREAYTTYFNAQSLEGAADGSGRPPATAPLIESLRTDYSQGTLSPTGSPQDLALSGEGFFLLEGRHGPLMTRAGSMRVAPDGRLTNHEGYEFATVEPQRIRADPLLPITVDPDGTVQQNGAPLGRLKIVERGAESQPPKREGVYFALDSKDMKGLTAARAEVRQGMTEASNYSAPEAAVRLVAVLRQFESLQKALQLGGEMGRKAVEEVARVNP